MGKVEATYDPSGPVVIVRSVLPRSVLMIWTVAPDTTAPLGSFTIPRISPVISCAIPTAVRTSADISTATNCSHDFFLTSINLLGFKLNEKLPVALKSFVRGTALTNCGRCYRNIKNVIKTSLTEPGTSKNFCSPLRELLAQNALVA